MQYSVAEKHLLERKQAWISSLVQEISQHEELRNDVADWTAFSAQLLELVLDSHPAPVESRIAAFVQQWIEPAPHPWRLLKALSLWLYSSLSFISNDREQLSVKHAVFDVMCQVMEVYCQRKHLNSMSTERSHLQVQSLPSNIQELIDGEKKYHTLFDTLHNALCILNKDMILDCNKSAETFLGMPRHQLVGQSFTPLFSNEHNKVDIASEITRKIQSSLQGESQCIECNYQRAPDEVATFEIRFSRFPEKASWSLLAVICDITEYKRTTEALKHSEARFRDIIRRSIDGYYFINVDLQMTHLNKAGQDILGYSKEEINEHILQCLDDQRHRHLRHMLKRALGGRTTVWEEFRFKNKQEVPRWIALNARRVYDGGRVLGVEGFIKDITSRKTAEIELSESEARYRTLVESIPFAVFGISSDYFFIKVNQNFKSQYGNVEGQKIESLEPARLSQLIRALCHRVETQHSALEQTIKLNDENIMRVIVAPIVTEPTSVIGFAGLLIDITQSVKALNEKKAFAEKLIQTSEEEQRRISREIHDSLGQMLFALQLELTAAKTALPEKVQRSQKLLNRSEQLLSQSIREAGDVCYRLQPRLLDDFGLVEALNDLAAHTKTQTMEVTLSAEQYSPQSQSIESALFRICQEAISNSVKHAQATQLKIVLRSSENCITLTISDDGDGFDVEEALQRQERGFGLLNIKERVELLEGDFELKSTKGKGTTICCSIPK